MAVVENVDTYITIQEMKDYVSKYYTSADPLRIQWEAMSQEDQEVYLRRAFDQINSLPFTGRPKNVNQKLPFPRYGNFTADDLLKIKYAQAEQSLAISDLVVAQETQDRLRLRRAGVVQYTIGDLSETFGNDACTDGSANFFGLSERAYGYLSRWLKGGYPICTSIKRHCGQRR